MIPARSEQVELLRQKIGSAAAVARNARGWSQEYVARQLNIDSETISRLERGVSIRLDRLLDLANLYNVPLASFFNDAPGPKLPVAQEISMAVAILDDANQQWVLQMVRSVVDKFVR